MSDRINRRALPYRGVVREGPNGGRVPWGACAYSACPALMKAAPRGLRDFMNRYETPRITPHRGAQ
ncbi:hypothetical protein GCM10010347_09080 [Streptomyces cirratus]|uniref:Uncharacterized protein n=1 Tax=Streptomyces cirratus TaxID=68187 RepID=A0ABQ3ERR5_9ACTN|nr:hypothetical protein GCM10010347_09080 [Streptomyces cirratus]